MLEQKEKVAYLFPGQGSQEKGMGKDLYDHSPAARAVFKEADRALGHSLTSVMFEGTYEDLTRTENAQPAITTLSLAVFRALEDAGIPAPRVVAGHSLGEYSALAAVGALSIRDTIRLVAARGKLMQHACDEKPGGMVALLGIDELAVEEISRETGIFLANINADGQLIISGDHPSLARAIDLARSRGARKCISLPVDGAFHSGLMEPAQSDLWDVIKSLDWREPVVPVIANCSARPMTDVIELQMELVNQLTSCVRWLPSVRWMLDSGIHDFVEVGPGHVLTGIMRRIDNTARVFPVSDMDAVRALAA